MVIRFFLQPGAKLAYLGVGKILKFCARLPKPHLMTYDLSIPTVCRIRSRESLGSGVGLVWRVGSVRFEVGRV
jgi:hypothetical protein